MILAVLLAVSTSLADTFVERSSGRMFNGYVVKIQKAGKTQVRVEGKRAEYLDLGAFEIRQNRLGRKNTVYVFSIKDPINLFVEAEAFETALLTAANQGPLFIMIDIDSPGGKADVAQTLCAAIGRIDNCLTVAYIGDGQFAGAYSAGAMVALACDKVYMREGASISGQDLWAPQQPEEGRQTQPVIAGYTATPQQWQSTVASIIERNKRPELLVNALIDNDIEVIEVRRGDVLSLIEAGKRKSGQVLVRTMSKKGEPLTLTASDAVKYGLADKVATSRQDLLAEFEAAKARIIRDTKMVRARRQLERNRTILDGMIASMNTTERRVAALSDQIATIEADMERVNKVIGLDRENIPRGYYRHGRREFALQDQMERHEVLTQQLVATLNRLLRDYDRALDISQPHKDLDNYTEAITASIEAARRQFEAKYKEVTFPRERFQPNERFFGGNARRNVRGGF